MLKQSISNGQLVLIDSELDQLQEYLRKIFSFIVGWFGGLNNTHICLCSANRCRSVVCRHSYSVKPRDRRVLCNTSFWSVAVNPTPSARVLSVTAAFLGLLLCPEMTSWLNCTAAQFQCSGTITKIFMTLIILIMNIHFYFIKIMPRAQCKCPHSK